MFERKIKLFRLVGFEVGIDPSWIILAFLIAVVGPISSFIMAGVFYGLQRYGAGADWPQPVGGVFGYLGMINLYLAIFNLAPAYPLDGGRIPRAALWGWKGNLRQSTRICSKIGSGFGITLVIFAVMQIFANNLIGGMWLFLIGMFIRGAARMSYQQMVTLKDMLDFLSLKVELEEV